MATTKRLEDPTDLLSPILVKEFRQGVRGNIFTGDAAKNRAELLCGRADMTYDAAISAASIERIRELWGRKPVYDIVTASGADETAQRADAVSVIAKKPFMVFDLISNSTGAPVFSSLVADKKIVVWSAATDAENGASQAPYRWNYAADPSSTPAVTAAFVGRTLTGKPAK